MVSLPFITVRDRYWKLLQLPRKIPITPGKAINIVPVFISISWKQNTLARSRR
jgi:uncharacterized membrane protein YdjX (TVP38/TMEM64 family)